jgi:hypothetical protein
MSALVFISKEGLQTTSRVVAENLAGANWQRAIGRSYAFVMKINGSYPEAVMKAAWRRIKRPSVATLTVIALSMTGFAR